MFNVGREARNKALSTPMRPRGVGGYNRKSRSCYLIEGLAAWTSSRWQGFCRKPSASKRILSVCFVAPSAWLLGGPPRNIRRRHHPHRRGHVALSPVLKSSEKQYKSIPNTIVQLPRNGSSVFMKSADADRFSEPVKSCGGEYYATERSHFTRRGNGCTKR